MKKFLAGLVTITLLVAALTGCGNNSTFDGSKTGDADHFDIEFATLNTSFTHDLELTEGDSLDVSIVKEAGDIALTIQCGNEDPVYRGNGIDSSEFKVGINESGVYTITVSGKKAKGHVVVKRG